MGETQSITVETVVNAPIETVWKAWTEPAHIMQWAFASDDWEAPAAENDVRVGGKFMTRMAAKDGSTSFDFNGVYTAVVPEVLMEYDIEGGRHVSIQFEQLPEGVKVTETFEMEHENSADMQRAGWQAILENFKKHAEAQA